jgi:hypothetical protein
VLSQFERIIKLVCLILAAILTYNLSRIAVRPDPLSNVTVPAVPTLASGKTGAGAAAAAAAAAAQGTNSKGATNAQAKAKAGAGNATNIVFKPTHRPAPLPPPNNSDLAKIVQARIELIVQSEILGPVIRPLPMALLGIAGKSAFFRAPDGQTGLLKEGEDLGGVKLLRIGTNRILVEQDGEKKELTIFEGYGGEPLLP